MWWCHDHNDNNDGNTHVDHGVLDNDVDFNGDFYHHHIDDHHVSHSNAWSDRPRHGEVFERVVHGL